jgi:hypothetical protein
MTTRTLAVLLAILAAVLSGCGRGPSLEDKHPVRVEGEVFLDGPDETRTPVSRGEEFAVALARIIDEGERAMDQKQQGIAWFDMTYDSGETDHIEITDTGLVRVKGVKTVQADLAELRKLLAGPVYGVKPGDGFSIYIESWDRVAFHYPDITEGKSSKWHNKAVAEAVIRKHLEFLAPKADVLLGTNLHINDKGYESEIDEIQNWLVTQGITRIEFIQAQGESLSPVVRIYEDGKVTVPKRNSVKPLVEYIP